VSALIAAASVVAPAGIAHAQPSADDYDCVFTLTAPQVVAVSGVPMVTSTMTAVTCNGPAYPNDTVVCVRAEGDSSAGACSPKVGPRPSRVFSPYRPGTVYIATGTGCASTDLGNSVCFPKGPISATL
jgi:hypothetical protein